MRMALTIEDIKKVEKIKWFQFFFVPLHSIMGRKIVLLMILALQTVASVAQESANEKQARRIFNQAYSQVFGEQGASLHYDVNIVGIYKTKGDITFKGKKQKFVDEKVNTWNDGVTAYMAFRKKKEVQTTLPTRIRRTNIVVSSNLSLTISTIVSRRTKGCSC